ncbi:ATP-binding protein [Streptomyces jumonjinensis]|uniref:ATP-binding protein n=1 Tax=Streptomyces jumonjinensis TaxID=1945 RepID=A0A646KFI3_STRJU|nr:ATP-binding protein [Streptomyces jumonjinensis]
MPTLNFSEWALPSCPFQRDSGRVNRDALHAPLLDPCSGADHHRYGFELPARVEYVSRARKLTRDRLGCWGIDGDVHDTAMLVISELVTNAIVHSGSHLISCELVNGVEQLRISVRDQGCAPTGPRVCHSMAAEERGRGLLLVEAVSSAWGAHADQLGTGRVVWAELRHTAIPYGADFPGMDFARAETRAENHTRAETRPSEMPEVPEARPGHPAHGSAHSAHGAHPHRGAHTGRTGQPLRAAHSGQSGPSEGRRPETARAELRLPELPRGTERPC